MKYVSSKIEEQVKRFYELVKKIKSYNEAINVMYWDLRTGAPKNGVEGRSEVIGMLSSEVFQMKTSSVMEQLLNQLSKHEEELDQITQKSVHLLKKELYRDKKIPKDKYQEYVVLVSNAESVWEEAKKKNDFSLFKPYLEKIVKFNQEFIELWGYEGNKYNALLDQYEPGMTVEQLDPIFKDLKDALVPLIQKVAKAAPVDTSFLKKEYDPHQQKELCQFILRKMGYDFEAGRLDETVHPFQITLNRGDARVTTKFEKNDLTTALFGTMHEGGHAQYEQNISKDLEKTPLAEGSSMGIHESQSRFWENMIGRNSLFWDAYYEYLVSYFPEQLGNIPKEDFYRAVNEMKPSLIRTEADELTYNFHIMIRYEIEKGLINGTIKVEELPTIWKEKMQEYLGIVPNTDAEGVLQDVHWSGGMIGYFPTYALGNIYAAQFYHQLKLELPNFNELLQKGDLIPIKNWLDDKIHRFGKAKTPNELLKDVTHESLNAKYLIEYLTEKVKDIYQV